jgi:hypothetical protein
MTHTNAEFPIESSLWIIILLGVKTFGAKISGTIQKYTKKQQQQQKQQYKMLDHNAIKKKKQSLLDAFLSIPFPLISSFRRVCLPK